MKQIWYSRNGPAHEVLGVTEAAVPELQDGQVLVALEAAPVHIADMKAVQGTLAFIDQTAGVPGCSTLARDGCGCSAFYPLDEYQAPHLTLRLAKEARDSIQKFFAFFS